MQLAIGLLGVCAIAVFGFVGPRTEPPAVVEHVNIEQYAGTWYAVASIPTTFERACARGTTATYELLEDGKVRVTNLCTRKDGTLLEAVGHAWIPNPEEPGKLKVSFVSLFGMWLFPGDYWILELDPNYRYAVVGHPKRRYGWILSRTPELPEITLEGIFDRLEEAGYDRASFRRIEPVSPAGA